MKKSILVVLCLVLSMTILSACTWFETPHEHDWSSEWSANDSEHWHACQSGDCTEVDSKGPHAGGSATCTEKAVCATCGEAYGELAEHVFDQEVVNSNYIAVVADCTNAAKYYKSCKCGAKGTETFESGEPADHAYVKEVVDERYLKSEATCQSPALYYKSCTCGEFATTADTFEDGLVAEHIYVWDKSADDKDVGTCSCGREITFLKALDIGAPAVGYFEKDAYNAGAGNTIILDKASVLEALPHLADVESSNIAFYVGEYKISGVNYENWGFNLSEQTELAADLKLHGYQDLIIRVTDELGETHDIKYPVLLITKIISGTPEAAAQMLYDLTYPATEDKYGCYDINGHVNFYQANINATLPTSVPEFAFKGVVIKRNSAAYVLRTDDIRVGGIFGRLDGAVIEGITIQVTQSFNELAAHKAILASSAVNSTFKNVSFTLSKWDGPAVNTPPVIAENIGYLVSDKFTGNVVVNMKLTTSVAFANNELPVLFGGFDKTNTIYNLTASGVNINLIGHSTAGGISVTLKYCDVKGSHTYGKESDNTNHWEACQICGEKKEGTTAAHAWDNANGVITTPASCEADGVRTWTCTSCGHKKTEVIAKLGHTYGSLVPEKAATCIATGNKAYYHCSVCDKYFDADKKAATLAELTLAKDAAAHAENTFKYTSNANGTHKKAHECCGVVVSENEACSGGNATCLVYANCQHCGAAYGEKLAHAASSDALWQSDDNEHWRVCATEGCDALVEKAPHAWGEGVIVTEATEEAEGLRRYTCSCGKTKDESIPKKDHVHAYELVAASAPDCDNAGNIEHYRCTGCGLLFTKSGDEYTQVTNVTLSALGHKLGTKYASDGTNHWRVCENAGCDHREDEVMPCNGGTATCENKAVCSVCGNEYGTVTGHSYTWDKTAEDKDVGTCSCGKTIEFDKLVEGMTAKRLHLADSTSNWASFSLSDAEINAKISSYASRNGFYVGDVKVSGDLTGVTYTNIEERRDLHGYQDVILKVIDETGEEHEIKLPMLFVTATIKTAGDWMNYIYPHAGDTYGYYELGASLNLTNNNYQTGSGLTSYPAPAGAFKGTLVGNGHNFVNGTTLVVGGGQYWNRRVFGKLDGATIKDITFVEYNLRGTCADRGFFGESMKNTTLQNVTIRIQGSDAVNAIDVSKENGWLVHGECSGNTIDTLNIVVTKAFNALPNILGNNCSNNKISNVTISGEGVTLPNIPYIYKDADGKEVTLCDVNGSTHIAGADWSHDTTGHWHSCTVCGAKADFAAHSGTTDLGDGTHKVNCGCGYTTEAVAHVYAWDKSAEDKDVGACSCGAKVEFDKTLDNFDRWWSISGDNGTKAGYFGANILTGESNKALYSSSLVDYTKNFVYSVNGTVFYEGTGSFDTSTNASLHALLVGLKADAWTRYDITICVTDIYGETHEIVAKFYWKL